MLLRFTNAALLALLVVLTATGVWGLFFNLHGWLFEVHRAAGFALLALTPAKVLIASRSLARGVDLRPGRRFDRGVMLGVSLLLAALTLLVFGLAPLWAWRAGPLRISVLGYADTAISWHWMLGLALLVPLALHVWRRWPKPRRRDFTSRRAALKLLGVGVAGAAGWWAAERLAAARADPAAPRRFTGSVEQGSFTGNGMPVTNNLGEGKEVIDASTWALKVHGAVTRPLQLSYAELLARPAAEKVATLDCTTGWYSVQAWQGVPLTELLAEAGLPQRLLAVRLHGVSGYFGAYTLDEAAEVLLASHVGGQTLDHWHGFPLRAVVPSRRGWFWIKWLTEVEVIGA